MDEKDCQRCGSKNNSFHALDAALVAKLKEAGMDESFPSEVCINCFTQLAGSVSRGSVLLAHEKAKEQKKLMMWKTRVNFIKKARTHMSAKEFSDAAVQYEKYLRVLEMVFEVEKGELKPELFKDSARTQELTVVASTYWDLLRIYDTSDQYGERQSMAAKKLAHFLKFTPIYPDIMRKAESFEKTARNNALIKQFIKSSVANKGKCFIATASFDSPLAPEVIFLMWWRDEVLINSEFGRKFIQFYYQVSPFIAKMIERRTFLKKLSRFLLKIWIYFLLIQFKKTNRKRNLNLPR